MAKPETHRGRIGPAARIDTDMSKPSKLASLVSQCAAVSPSHHPHIIACVCRVNLRVSNERLKSFLLSGVFNLYGRFLSPPSVSSHVSPPPLPVYPPSPPHRSQVKYAWTSGVVIHSLDYDKSVVSIAVRDRLPVPVCCSVRSCYSPVCFKGVDRAWVPV